MPLLSVQNLSVRFGARTVVHKVSFQIEPGECVAIVGESGSGKSVTARTLLGLSGGAVESSEMLFDGKPLALARKGHDIGFIPQGALVALDPLRPIGREIGDSLRLHTSLSAVQRLKKVHSLLKDVGMPEPELRATQRSGELSGGLRQRALIASAIALSPRLLLADEPTTSLDTTVQAGILELLSELQQGGTALLIISHDLAVVARLATRIIVMRAGVVVEAGLTADVLRAPKHPYTQELVAAVPSGRRAPSPRGETVLEGVALSKTFGKRRAVDAVSFTLERGRTLGVVGESGSGKTTLARLMLALAAPDVGTVTLGREQWNPALEKSRRARRPRIGAIYQDALSSFDPRLTVVQILRDALGADPAELLQQVGLDARVARQHPRLLSGGQQQRVAIARAIAAKPEIIICDEPVSSLDVSVQAQILALLEKLQRELGLSYVFITHDLAVVRQVSDDLIVMRDGRVLEQGPTESIFTHPRHDYTRALLAAPTLSVPLG